MLNLDKDIAESAIERTRQVGRLEGDNETIIWHLTRAIMEWCDAQKPRIDFDSVLENVREDFNRDRSTLQNE